MASITQASSCGTTRGRRYGPIGAITAALALLGTWGSGRVWAQEPTVLDPNLGVRTVVSGLDTPSSMAFLGPGDFLVLEKNTGQVKRVVNGVVQGVVLDLAVNFGSERGLLGIALHPNFSTNGFVYLYWTWRGSGEAPGGLMGPDTDNLAELPSVWFTRTSLLLNRVDRFVWNGSSLTFDKNISRLRAYQADPGQPLRGNHNGGVIRFGPDGKLYVIIGDNGRRGQMQNLPSGPTLTGLGATVADDQFGGPAPDRVHLTGVVLRLNDDGTAPADNPFFNVGAAIGGEVGANIRKVFSYGHRNSFGLAFDPVSGALWESENADDAFDEINRILPGMNGGWIQFMGPAERLAELKQIELALPPSGGVPGAELQQLRWPPSRLADSTDEAMARLFALPGSQYIDPEFSWKFAIAPAAIGFLNSGALGEEYRENLFVGAAVPFVPGFIPTGGYLLRLKLTDDRQHISSVDDARLEDRVADNTAKFDLTESESLSFGTGFGVATDIQTGPNGNLFVVSLSNGAIYEIFRIEE